MLENVFAFHSGYILPREVYQPLSSRAGFPIEASEPLEP